MSDMSEFFGSKLDELMEVVGPETAFRKAQIFFASTQRMFELTHALLAVCADPFAVFHWKFVRDEIHDFAARYKIKIQPFDEDDLKRLVTRATQKGRNGDLVPICGLYMMAKVQVDESLRKRPAIIEVDSFEDFVSEAKQTFFGDKVEISDKTPQEKTAQLKKLREFFGADRELEKNAYLEIFGKKLNLEPQATWRDKVYLLCYRNSVDRIHLRKSFIEIATPASKGLDYFEFRHVYKHGSTKRVATGTLLLFENNYYLLGGSGRMIGRQERNINEGIKVVVIPREEMSKSSPGRYRALYVSHDKSMKPIVGRLALVRVSTKSVDGEYFEKDLKLDLVERSKLRSDLEAELSHTKEFIQGALNHSVFESEIADCEEFVLSIVGAADPTSDNEFSGPLCA